MLTVMYGLLSLVLVLGGGIVVYDARSYTEAQRARAPRLSRAYLGSGVLLVLVGVTGLLWIASGRSVWTLSAVLVVAAALPSLVQHLLHRRLGLDRSPLENRIRSTSGRTSSDSE
ncbi:hypothetical protein [Natronorubrum sulfidifaciens]|uniref:Uncharacterized protein n=1 Tax=Natronorubrum sulfidifaciens JCM 14089 TaxID=1230460 RepID=L9WJV2_9EURY|nr:hypothetical protein [Natronorubrum sulfidifaciens]ELY49481.1 hypothetical protein C495_00910 [Natronorubrum sulfidifaciens JCM 14089]